MAWQAAFAIGVLRDIYAFHRYSATALSVGLESSVMLIRM